MPTKHIAQEPRSGGFRPSIEDPHYLLSLIENLLSLIQSGNIAELDRFAGIISPQGFRNLIEQNNYKFLIKAIETGRLEVVQCLLKVFPESQHGEILAVEDGLPVRVAIEYGHLDILKHMVEVAPDVVQEATAFHGYNAFRRAMRLGHANVCLQLFALADEDKKIAMLTAKDYFAFLCAALNGQRELIKDFIDLLRSQPGKLYEMVSARNHQAFIEAIKHGHTDVALQLIDIMHELAPDKVAEMLVAQSFEAFNVAILCGYSHLTRLIINKLTEVSPDRLTQMLIFPKNRPLLTAAKEGHTDIVEQIVSKLNTLAPTKLRNILTYQYNQYISMLSQPCSLEMLAAKEKTLFVLADSMKKAAPDLLEKMMLEQGTYAMRYALSSGDKNLVARLINLMNEVVPDKLQEIMASQEHFMIDLFVDDYVDALVQTKADYARTLPSQVFNLDAKSAQLCFALMHNLLHQPAIDYRVQQEIQTLLEVPAVRERVEQHARHGQNKKLCKLALQIAGQEFVRIPNTEAPFQPTEEDVSLSSVSSGAGAAFQPAFAAASSASFFSPSRAYTAQMTLASSTEDDEALPSLSRSFSFG